MQMNMNVTSRMNTNPLESARTHRMPRDDWFRSVISLLTYVATIMSAIHAPTSCITNNATRRPYMYTEIGNATDKLYRQMMQLMIQTIITMYSTFRYDMNPPLERVDVAVVVVVVVVAAVVRIGGVVL